MAWGLVFQRDALWPHLSVWQTIAFGLEVQKVSSAETKQRVEAVAEALQIDPYLERYTSELSGGQQQRVAIACGAGRAAVRLVSVLPTDADWYYRVALGDDIVTVRDDRHPGLRKGDAVVTPHG